MAKEKKPKKKSGCLSKLLIGMVVLAPFSIFFGEDENSTELAKVPQESTAEILTTVTSEAETKTQTTAPETENEMTEEVDPLGFSVIFSDTYRNDVTGNWRLARISANIDIEKYALQYYQNYFKSNKEIHIIVNFTLNTTTKLSVVGNILDVTILDYVKGEEHDAKVACSGNLLKEYFVDIETGEIEEIQ